MHAAEVSPTGSFWRRWKWRFLQWRLKMASKNRQITLAVPVAEYDAFVEEARERGLTLAEWARQKLRAPARPEPRVLDEAFRRIDESDAQRDFKEPPAAPEIYPPVSPLVALGTPMQGAEPHACVHHTALLRHDGGFPRVCANSSQVGRPCYFPSASARDCHCFHPKAGY